MIHRRRCSGGFVAVLAVSLLAVAAPALGQPRPDRGPLSFVARYAQELGLDAATQAKLEEVVARSRKVDEELQAKLHGERERMRELLDGVEDPEEDAVMRQADAITAVETELHKNRLRAILAIHKLLSPEQRRELARLRDEHMPPPPHHRRGGPPAAAFAACRPDQRRLCPDAERGRELLACLHEQWDALSEACRDAFEP